jgi:anthranilate phosphoribosyltransferase
VPVAKHGNRAITSRSGSADVLDALGVRIDHDAESAARELDELGFAFLFAPVFHPAMRHAGPTRREIGVRTAFNLIGPLTNPAGAMRAVIGVADPVTASRIAEVAGVLGTERTFVVHGASVDELPLDGSGVIHDVTSSGVVERRIDARSVGLAAAETSALAGGTAIENAEIVERVFAGEPGPRRDVVLLNAGAALLLADRARDLEGGVALARVTLDAGAPAALLERLRASRTGAEREALDEPRAGATRS